MTRNRILPATIAGLSLCLAGGSAQALTIDPSGTTDNSLQEPVGGGDSASSTVDGSSTGFDSIANVVGNTAMVTPRVRGQVSTTDGPDLSQTIDVTFEYAITGASGVTYDLTLDPEFHGILKIADDLADESGDIVVFQAMKAMLDTGSGAVAVAGLDLGASFDRRTTDGFTVIDRVATGHTVSLTGDATVTLSYSLNLADDPLAFSADSAGGISANCTQAGAMWGHDSPLSTGGAGCSGSADFLDYNSAANRAADGLFGAATVEITAVPEPGTLLLVGSGLAGLLGIGRRRA